MQPSLFPSPGVSPAPSPVNRQVLNASQFEAATTVDGPVLVIAGAGSGKTRTLVYRVAHLVESGVAPEKILLLTFTRKAAEEMLSRASGLLNDSVRHVTGGTFHAVANKLLRRHGAGLGFAPNFTILDQGDAEGIINLIKSSLGLGAAGKRFPNKHTIVAVLSKSVNRSMALADLLDDQYPHLADFAGDLRRINEDYRKFKLEHGLMDYDDLLVNWQRLLSDEFDLRPTIAGLFSHIMVDEYQDTNQIQAAIVRGMALDHHNVMVVGDDAQSIYSFRGADFRNIMDFPAIFPHTRIIRLEENYRSTQPILSLTNGIIAQATEKYTKQLFSTITEGEPPVIHGARDEAGQARFVVDRITALHRQGIPLSDIAVLFRSGFHSYKLELELTNRQIPFEKRGGLKLTESAHVKDVIAYLRVVTNPADRLSWNRILLLLDKVGPKTARLVLDAVRGAEDPVAALKAYPAGPGWKKGLHGLADTLASLHDPGLAPSGQLDLLLEYYRPLFERIYYDDYPRRGSDLEHLRTILAGYDTLQHFIDDTALEPPQAATDGTADYGAGGDRLILSTIHSAKGLEWDTVFVIHLAEGAFPSPQSFQPEQREEERRLLYVAATRAKQRLYLTYPREIMAVDRSYHHGALTPFLADLPAGLYRAEGGGDFAAPGFADRCATPRFPASASRSRSPVRQQGGDADGFPVGTEVRHNFFGQGTVRAIAGPRTVEVFFPRHGVKTLHLDYAKLERLDP
ncbi:MAG: DNA helicase UvrD [Deltaproteobacteria bacterium CG23_combo_of_CG06-09_8_20_14_all_60_8]|nr:MAG: DNA helicase UvrD [Desulfobacterales bacterium CG2_30_60_27]PIP43867.1 MAG: DNA helicase UvrD [Deltaproteobacteria bacterium CG23_combo_of_CG06-09_8_20_14_all_60_8]